MSESVRARVEKILREVAQEQRPLQEVIAELARLFADAIDASDLGPIPSGLNPEEYAKAARERGFIK